jgi:hypothetical protein
MSIDELAAPGSTCRPARPRRVARGRWVVLAVLSVSVVATLVSATYAAASSGARLSAGPATTGLVDPGVSGEAASVPPPDRRDDLPISTGRARPLVVLYGDSLAWEARDHFVWALAAAGADVQARTMGGTAICDFLPAMHEDAGALRPDAVVVEFSGNALTPCIRGNGALYGREEHLEAYRADARSVLSIFPSARVYFAGAPMAATAREQRAFHGGAFNDLYREVAASDPDARYVDAGAAVLDHGRWTRTLPCLPEEPCTGGIDALGRSVNVVRASDGAHLCPAAALAVDRGVTSRCTVWSSGAYRYGTAMAAAVIADLPGR